MNYFAQRRPEELGRFAWMIDRKERAVTEMERLWATLMLPMGESRGAQRPYAKVEGFDYSYFAKYARRSDGRRQNEAPPEMDAGDTAVLETPHGRLCIVSTQSESGPKNACLRIPNNLGLQLADIAASTLCRALNGNLQQARLGADRDSSYIRK